ncbi:MAG: ankyrin repeat domain-containing protein [Alphaproteobacteria bacterium]|nr:ankyrin repeat domain-containing protein [Alphaproteobacteria bacterium]
MHRLFLFLFLSTPVLATTEQVFEQHKQADSELARDDQTLNRLYQEILRLLPKHEQEAFKQTERGWLKERGNLPSLEKIKESYTQRLGDLRTLKKEKEKPYTASFFSKEAILDKAHVLDDLKKCPTFSCRLYELVIEALDLPPKDRDAFLGSKAKALYEKDQILGGTKITWPLGTSAKIEEILFMAEHGFFLENEHVREDLTVPLWLAIKVPDLMNYDTGASYRPYGLEILTNTSMSTLPHYEAFDRTLDDLFVGNWLSGTLYRTFYSTQARIRDFISFAPTALEAYKKAPSLEDKALHHPELLKWSYLGPWNRKKYQALEKVFPAMASDLRAFYESVPPLAAFAAHTTRALNAYLFFNFDTKIPLASDKAYALFVTPPEKDLDRLFMHTKDFNQTDWSAALAYAVLSGRPVQDLKRLVEKGAKVDAVIDEETPLMKAADRPDVLLFLLSQKASVDARNDFGKTPLFYAVQFNNLDSVKALVEAGANVNTPLKVMNEERYYEFQFILGFTPLAYSMRYGSPEMTAYLVEKGARLDGIDQETLKEWVSASGEEERFKTHLALVKK